MEKRDFVQSGKIRYEWLVSGGELSRKNKFVLKKNHYFYWNMYFVHTNRWPSENQ